MLICDQFQSLFYVGHIKYKLDSLFYRLFYGDELARNWSEYRTES